MNDSLPPTDRKYSVLAEKAVDMVAIVAMTCLGVFAGLDVKFAACLIALFAGVNIGQALSRIRGGPGGLIFGLLSIAQRGGKL